MEGILTKLQMPIIVSGSNKGKLKHLSVLFIYIYPYGSLSHIHVALVGIARTRIPPERTKRTRECTVACICVYGTQANTTTNSHGS